jgi:hypothetical protein
MALWAGTNHLPLYPPTNLTGPFKRFAQIETFSLGRRKYLEWKYLFLDALKFMKTFRSGLVSGPFCSVYGHEMYTLFRNIHFGNVSIGVVSFYAMYTV